MPGRRPARRSPPGDAWADPERAARWGEWVKWRGAWVVWAKWETRDWSSHARRNQIAPRGCAQIVSQPSRFSAQVPKGSDVNLLGGVLDAIEYRVTNAR